MGWAKYDEDNREIREERFYESSYYKKIYEAESSNPSYYYSYNTKVMYSRAYISSNSNKTCQSSQKGR